MKEGIALGFWVGLRVKLGFADGSLVGLTDGLSVGLSDGLAVVGLSDGFADGLVDGRSVGRSDGLNDGLIVHGVIINPEGLEQSGLPIAGCWHWANCFPLQ